MERNPRLLSFAQSWLGQLFIFLVFGAALSHLYPMANQGGRNSWPQILAASALCAVAGAYRAQALAVTTLVCLLLHPDWYPSHWLGPVPDSTRYLALAGVLLAASILFKLRQRYPRNWLARRPVALLLLAYFSAIVGVNGLLEPGQRTLGWTILWATGCYLWYLAYALRDASAPKASPLWFQLASFHPYFAGTWIHIGLGAANLRQRQARGSKDLAICQIKAVKLVLFCCLMQIVKAGLSWLRLKAGLPFFHQLIVDQSDGKVFYSAGACWLSLIISFFEDLAANLAFGNLMVACARLGGFNLLQQTYKPLQARSLLDFWNRISYYYKQLVLEMFFYPTFLTFYKRDQAKRQAFALLMTVVVGNFIYHFRQLVPLVARQGLVQTLLGMQVYACYCVLLYFGLLSSLLMTSSARPAVLSPVARLWLLVRIVLFYSLLNVFDDLYTQQTILARMATLSCLFSL